MKIGEFSKKFGVKKSQVRFYVDRHMIVPVKDGTYPDYDETCVKDMTFILKYRSYGFSIEEISKLLLYKRYRQTEDEAYRDNIGTLLKNKLNDFEEEIKILIEKKAEIEEELSQIESEIVHSVSHGVQVGFLDKLVCSKCHEKYEVENANIKHAYLVSGYLKCTCSKLTVQEGIIYSEDFNPDNLLSVKMRLDANIKNDYYVELKKAGKHMSDRLMKWDHSLGIFFFNAAIEIVTTDLDKYLLNDGYYIFSNYNLKRLKEVREYIIKKDFADRCIFVHFTKDYPLENTCKYFVDFGGYASDLIHMKESWLISNIQHIFTSSESGLYLDYGYYPTNESYYKVYDQLFDRRTIHSKDISSAVVLDKDLDKIIKIRLVEFNK
ncbi:MerR family transcriptional regulator [Acidaminobacter sp. JC074]|uniref:MerR family transcriptional regulator n=1 Tax=Acidaminobacter sp. JC074 TaxID=2530199 RepID=UPI001F0D80E4|nr:MerR family transcriptional regulator [Acidaminobacter sp. JC074]